MPTVKRQYTVDLKRPADRRWAEMIAAERTNARRLVRSAISLMQEEAGDFRVWLAREVIPRIHACCGDNFGEDLDAWSEGADIDRDDLVLANLSYELVQVGDYWQSRDWKDISVDVAEQFAKTIEESFGCTAMAFNLDGNRGVAHVRNLDWDLKGCGPKSVIIHYKGEEGPFTAPSWPGFVGVLSGVAPGRFSATINMAPQVSMPGTQWPVTFALRIAFEECGTFDEAVKYLTRVKLAASTLFMVVGTKKDQAVVIEHTGSKARCRWMEDGVLVVTNHYVYAGFTEHNKDDEDSEDRLTFAEEAARRGARLPLSKMLPLLGRSPVLWERTRQRMAFVPKSGEFLVHYWDRD
jgi:hypothetical protein